jgi:hypothetical protein
MRFALTVAIFLLLFGLARRYGRGPEQQVAGILLANFMASIVHVMVAGQVSFDSMDRFVAVVDFVSLVAIVWIALRANRMWPLLIAALQLVVMIAHFSVFIEFGSRTVYWGMMAISQYLQLGVLAGGVVMHHRREKRAGPYRSWRSAFPT